MQRLNKFLAASGLASRRACDELIKQGKVSVNGKIVSTLGTKIDPTKDKVKVNGKEVKPPAEKVYIMLHKPAGFITSASNIQGKTIFNLLRDVDERVFPVGRLDKDTSGLLLLTNDGDFANEMMHPRYEHEKEYVCETLAPLTPTQLSLLQNGVDIGDEKKTLPAKVRLLEPNRVSITIREGRNRQIRRMIQAVGNSVVALKRIRLGKYYLADLPEGKWKKIRNPKSENPN